MITFKKKILLFVQHEWSLFQKGSYLIPLTPPAGPDRHQQSSLLKRVSWGPACDTKNHHLHIKQDGVCLSVCHKKLGSVVTPWETPKIMTSLQGFVEAPREAPKIIISFYGKMLFVDIDKTMWYLGPVLLVCALHHGVNSRSAVSCQSWSWW